MAFLKLSLFGTFHLAVDGQAVSRFRSQREAALLAYLAVENQQPHSRERLAGLLWPDKPESAARQNLRQTLTNLRDQLHDDQHEPPFLLTDRYMVSFNRTSNYLLDVERFTATIAETTAHPHPALLKCPTCLAELAAAVALYHGPLLSSFAFSGSDLFEEWLLFKREQFHHQAILALGHLSSAALQHRAAEQALIYARRQSELDPLNEEAHRNLLNALALAGDRSGALAHFALIRARLQEELGVEPSAETQALVEKLRASAPVPRSKQPVENQAADKPVAEPVTPSAPLSPQPRQDWGGTTLTGQLVGRTVELAQLERWLQQGVRITTVHGTGGVGKTTLALHVAHHYAQQVDIVIWRSLLNAPSLSALLADWQQRLDLLSGGNELVHPTPAEIDSQLDLLFATLRQRRCLLLLDNVESIMQRERGGRFQLEYEAYSQLLQRMAREPHQSSLLLVSREQPQELARLEEDLPVVRALQIQGIPFEAGPDFLRAHGLTHFVTRDAVRLMQRFSGNPLVLKFMVSTIHEFFAGDVAAFLAEETPIIGDLRDLFDQYRLRIPYTEKVILMWLSIQREPMPIATLRSALTPAVSTSVFLEAVHSLQRRSLIEQTEEGATVSNVIRESMLDYLIEYGSQEIVEEKSGVLNHYALVQAHATEEVRQSQISAILAPLAHRLCERIGQPRVIAQIKTRLHSEQQTAPIKPGYLVGNLLNLLAYLHGDLRGLNLAHLTIWQANLVGVNLAGVNFQGADLRGSRLLAIDPASGQPCANPDHYLGLTIDGVTGLSETEQLALLALDTQVIEGS